MNERPSKEAGTTNAPVRVPVTCSAPYRVRFDEAGPDGRLRTSVLLRYAQDLAWHHSATRGFGRAWYEERAITWLVRTAEVAVLAPILTGAELVGTTQVVGWRRVWARRRTEFRDPDGELVAWVHIDWLLLDARGTPTRIPAEFGPIFGGLAATLSLARVELDPTPDDAARAAFTVRPQELDPMDHVNNAVYADWLDEAVLATAGRDLVRAIPRLARLEYARAADPGVTVVAQTWPAAGGWSCRVVDGDGADLLRARLQPGPVS